MKRRILFGSIAVVAVSGAVAAAVILPQIGGPVSATTSVSVIPQPAKLEALGGEPFVLSADLSISTDDAALVPVAEYFAEAIGSSTDVTPTVAGGSDASITFALDPALAEEAYEVHSTQDGIRITAGAPAGAFWAVQSLRQLVSTTSPWTVPTVDIEDSPRFAYRGAMLDVARHFFTVDDVKRYIDDIVLLKINYLHLHLTDDQGWRLEIKSRPLLTEVGSRYGVTGDGGYYTQDDYRELVGYAASRFITIVPEIDVPGHTNAALASYGELNPDGQQAKPYTGIEVGFSSLDANSEVTYEFLEDVFREVAELTPGPYLHIGGDESRATSDADFETFVARASQLAADTGKTVIGWHEMGQSDALPAGSVGQYWNYTDPQTPETAEHALSFVEQGGRLIMSPANVAYLDMKYDIMTHQGLTWADGFTGVEEAYSWDPADVLPGVGDEQLLGVEAPLWSETLESIDDIEFMAFPRLAAAAELAWSPRGEKDFAEFAPRLAEFGVKLDALGIGYHRATGVPWKD